MPNNFFKYIFYLFLLVIILVFAYMLFLHIDFFKKRTGGVFTALGAENDALVANNEKWITNDPLYNSFKTIYKKNNLVDSAFEDIILSNEDLNDIARIVNSVCGIVIDREQLSEVAILLKKYAEQNNVKIDWNSLQKDLASFDSLNDAFTYIKQTFNLTDDDAKDLLCYSVSVVTNQEGNLNTDINNEEGIISKIPDFLSKVCGRRLSDSEIDAFMKKAREYNSNFSDADLDTPPNKFVSMVANRLGISEDESYAIICGK